MEISNIRLSITLECLKRYLERSCNFNVVLFNVKLLATFCLSLTAADRPFEILGHYSFQTLFDNRMTRIKSSFSDVWCNVMQNVMFDVYTSSYYSVNSLTLKQMFEILTMLRHTSNILLGKILNIQYSVRIFNCVT